MGEIGLNRLEYLYNIQYWELLLISRGYARRHREEWSMTRWQTWNIMSATVGGKGMREAHLYRMSDLILFPWEREVPVLTDEDRAELQADLDAENKRLKQSQQS